MYHIPFALCPLTSNMHLASNMYLCIGAFIAAMELSQADLIVEFTQYFVLILY